MHLSQEVLSNVTVWAKYAKFIPEIHRREDWDEICDRNQAMHINKYPQLRDEIKANYKYIRQYKNMPSMRSMQFAGAPIDLSNSRIFNCAFAAVNDPHVFAEIMFLLLGGSGVGFSVQKHHVEQLPTVQGPTKKTRRFLIGDSIEGWAEAVKVLTKSYFRGKSDPVFDYRDIRQKGARLVTSGGKAPGPDPLRICLDEIRKVLNGAVGRKLTTIECHDIICYIADAVLSGGIRRAALLSLFSHDDMDMLSAKSGMWWELNPQRGRSNNSAVLHRATTTYEQFMSVWERVQLSGAGEPGIYWTNDLEWGANPCVVGDTMVTCKFPGEIQEIQIPIKELTARWKNDEECPLILTINEETGNREWKPLVAAAMTKIGAKLVSVTDEATGKTVICTPDHKILTKNRGWVQAKDLLEEDILIIK